MKTLLFWWLMGLPLLALALAQTPIKENLGPAVNGTNDQILPVFSRDGRTMYFSENAANGRYETWFSRRDAAGHWQPKQRTEGLNPPTDGGKYVFAEVDEDLLLVNGWFERTGGVWTQSKGLSWYVPSRQRYVRLDIPALQTRAQGRFVNAFLHRPTKTLLLSYAEGERKNLYVCRPENPAAPWTTLRWQAPVRLPAPLNSDYDDTTPFLDADGTTLYFASNRPGGYGAEDIYRARRLGDGWARWSPPENLGFSVNSNFAELYYCVAPGRDFAHFVSYKHSLGSGDIFRLRADLASRAPVAAQPTPLPPPPAEVTELTVAEYRPNNLVFLIDRSASMRPSHKLPLLKLSLKRLIGELRDIDRLTLMSFADSAVVHFSARGVTEKDSLYRLIDGFLAAGQTKAHRGLQRAYDHTGRHYVEGGNNEIILVTDGLFDLSARDRRRIRDSRNVVLSAVALGNSASALSNLRELAGLTDGSFIHLRRAETGTEALLEEVKARSRR